MYLSYVCDWACRQWEASGKPVPPPAPVKQKVIRDLAKRYRKRVFIETGTYMGDTVFALRRSFATIYSIELSQSLYERAKRRFKPDKHVTLLQGDSSEVLPRVLAAVNQPCLFWLDGHYSVGVTARGATDTPIRRELDCIFEHPIAGHVILIDDARDFSGADGYPTIDELREFVGVLGNFWCLEVEDDIIRIFQDPYPANISIGT